ncbi:DUF1501 domain-containing protein [Alienimonas sp. DA493]|uniref:DUF1501 domain-containing protein n=1 Tax=Alienimonas sp. DA493 TaxID=3373605 RepID=UPI00375516CF
MNAHPALERDLHLTRRRFFGRAAGGMGAGIGAAALGSLLGRDLSAAESSGATAPVRDAAAGGLHFAPKAKRVISLFMSGAPSQLDMWDYKPQLNDLFDEDLPDSVRNGQRITTMTSGQARFPLAPSKYKFARHGQHGAWVSELLPHTASVVDDLCVVKSMWTEAINHDPAITYIQTGSQLPGRPSTGAWASYGLGSLNEDLPTFVVLHSSWSGRKSAQALYNRLWGSGFLPTRHAGVALRSKGDPVLYLSDPPGVSRAARRDVLDGLAALNQKTLDEYGDPEIATRIAQYEMAYRMQASVPELMDLSGETQETLDLYGPDVNVPGTFAANCLLARRLAERDVRFTQIFIRGWDQHGNVAGDLPKQCKDVDQACAALVTDLKRRGLLDDTLVVWGGEFGRTVYCQGKLTRQNYGRDHHPRCFTTWLAGGGVKPGIVYGETDDFSYNVTENPVHIHDLNATILHQLGIDHEKLTYRYQGRDFRLTDVHGNVVHDILA